MRVAVAGGTGQVGARVVSRLRERGDDVVVLGRSAGVDLESGAGLAGALDGVDAVLDCTSTPAQSRVRCVHFFGAVARHLQTEAARAGVRRVVTLSIVGIDRMPGLGHYAGKLAQEEATRAGDVPATILRATQFHTFPLQLASQLGVGPLRLCLRQPVQPVDVDTVVSHLVRLVDGADEGRTVELAGPQVVSMTTAARRAYAARGRRRVVVPLVLPGASARAARRGAALAGEDTEIDGRSLDEWVAAGAPG
ncbi:nucleoside-diphosphate sugar epimerase [Marmoricola endophyticus]|uniref:Nucleoside-diphosphate sugar epimerase n=1 Tax=Marmoricola endophyticus TaxID=2040280 RepID=A0A917BNS3_9ACTN|nr:NAD(P)H-binding protein [Marmoricola endophyticus]GGF53331.1 nucleoside-diphosphate sugar epimerase [Marmoricola endophyticus]